jgi:hypothetical protein
VPPLEETGDGSRRLRVIAGEGMLVATVDGYYTDQYGRHEIKAGISRVAPDHPLARARPEAFRVAWKEDAIVMRQHRHNLRERMKELRGEHSRPRPIGRPITGDAQEFASPARPTTRPSWYIGS